MLEKKYKALEKEEKWRNYWKENNVYKFDRNSNKKVFSIDTPPPTISGKIHIGHIFSYSQTEMLARYKRLRGYNVFYPFGFDDNGLPTERLVEKEIGKKASELSIEKFTELCRSTTEKYEEDFKELFDKLGISTDWDYKYNTASDETALISQRAFLDLASKGASYYGKSPALWCKECLTTFAQAELETKTKDATFNYINFDIENSDEKLQIATTRPELLPAIVAVFVHPDDEKRKHLIGKTAIIPVVNAKVKIIGDEKVDMEKGTGAVMSCTFGDQTDIEWWRKYNLELKTILTDDGRIKEDVENYGGLYISKARKQIVEDLTEAGAIIKIDNITHEVQVHERCGTPVEYKIMNQWFINTTDKKKELLEMGDKISWHPAHMKSRYVEWVENVMWDWCISRQRYYGIPLPVWYEKDTGKPVFPQKEELPINPLVSKPKGYENIELIPETDVMDTWATSSVTPQINMRYKTDKDMSDIMNPMSIRTNASDIIRTWDFYTIVRSLYEFDNIPWNDVMISGFVMAGKGEKISKSKGNSKVEPLQVLDTIGADILRYWAGTGRLGTDITYSDETLQRGKKLVNKIWNVSKFIGMHLEDFKDGELKNPEYIDAWVISKYMDMEKKFIKYLEEYEVGLALNTLEKFFWNFCDNYIEIVKHRLYRPEEFGDDARWSGQKTVYTILFKLLQNFSIYLPYITEEIYQDLFVSELAKTEKSIHITEIKNLDYDFGKYNSGDSLLGIVSDLRGEKTKAGVSLKTEYKKVTIEAEKDVISAIKASEKDIKASMFITNLELIEKEAGSFDNDLKYAITEKELLLED